MIITMDMSSYETDKDAMESDYGEEIMSSGWNPSVDLVCEQLQEISPYELVPAAVKLAALYSLDDI